MSVYDRVVAGEYNTKLPYPERVKEPAIMRKMAKDLTPDELVALPSIVAQYEADKVAYNEARAAYSADGGRLSDQFKADLEAENGVVGHPKADLLWSKAYDHGHSAGFAEITIYYNDFVDLIK
jgi:hypothetical protein